MSDPRLKQLQLTFILFLFNFKLLDTVTHGQDLRLQLGNLVHDSSARLSHGLCLFRVVAGEWIGFKACGVE